MRIDSERKPVGDQRLAQIEAEYGSGWESYDDTFHSAAHNTILDLCAEVRRLQPEHDPKWEPVTLAYVWHPGDEWRLEVELREDAWVWNSTQRTTVTGSSFFVDRNYCDSIRAKRGKDGRGKFNAAADAIRDVEAWFKEQ